MLIRLYVNDDRRCLIFEYTSDNRLPITAIIFGQYSELYADDSHHIWTNSEMYADDSVYRGYDALQGSEEFEYHAITWPLIPIFMHFFESTWVL